MKLPSQIDSLSMLKQLEDLEQGESIENNSIVDQQNDAFPESGATWLLSQLKGAFDIKGPAFYPFPASSREMFSWVERNNQISEETLRSLVFDEIKLQRIKTELEEYSEDIPPPQQIKLCTATPVDHELLYNEQEKTDTGGNSRAPNCFIWKWGKFHAFIAPQEIDFNKVDEFQKELNNLKIMPDAFVLMPYSFDPLEKLEQDYGSELWHNYPPKEPLLWEETKIYLEALRCQKEFENSLRKKQN
jgi:hypothetical protein